MQTQFEVTELERTRQCPVRAELPAKPTVEELCSNCPYKAEERKGRKQFWHPPRDAEGWVLQGRVPESLTGSGTRSIVGGTENA